MKKLLLGLGTIAAVAVPTVAVVSCSLGSVFKSKINDINEAKTDVEKIFKELSATGTLDSDVDKFTSELSAKDVLKFVDGLNADDIKGMTFDVSNLEMKQGRRVTGYGDWTGTHNDMYSSLEVTLKDGSKAHASVFFKYDKTNGVWAGTSKRGWLVNGAIAVANYATKMKHVISDITISRDDIYVPFTS